MDDPIDREVAQLRAALEIEMAAHLVECGDPDCEKCKEACEYASSLRFCNG